MPGPPSGRAGRAAAVGLALGLAIMLAASVWAPAQPDMIEACDIATCGTVEDPARWRAAWYPWSVGAFLTIVATAGWALTTRPPPGTPWQRARLGVLVILATPVTVVVGLMVSFLTSIHGFATVAWAATALPLVALAVLVLRDVGARVAAPRTPRPTALSHR